MTRVLVVDDSDDARYYASTVLTANGFEVTTARDGAEALDLARAFVPDVILSDLLMPVMDGFTLLRHWKADGRLKRVPFMVYTATYTDPDDETLAFSLGADAFILKPSEPDELLRAVRGLAAASLTRPPLHGAEWSSHGPLELYNAALVRKLEVKSIQLEEAYRALQLDVGERQSAEAARRTSDAQFQALAEAMPQMLWVSDAEGLNTYVNARWTAYTGLSAQDSLDRGWMEALHPDDRSRGRMHWVKAAHAKDTYTVEYRIRGAGGAYRWWLVRGVPLLGSDGDVEKWFGTCTDIHDLKLAELQVLSANRALQMMSNCNEAVIRATGEQSLLEEVCRIAVEVGGYRMAWVGYAPDDDAGRVTPQAHAGVEDGYLSDGTGTSDEHHAFGKGPEGEVIRAGKAVVCEDLLASQGVPHLVGAASQRRYRGVVVLPLCEDARTFGFISLYSSEVNTMTPEELKLLGDLAENLAFGINALRARAAQQRLQTAVVRVAGGVSAATGIRFYEQLAQSMAEALGADDAYLATVLPGEPLTALLIGTTAPDMVTGIEFPIAGTPCETLLTVQTHLIADRLHEYFPHFGDMTRASARAFVGQRLESTSGQPLGFLFVLFDRPVEHGELIESTLRIFAARAAAEIERARADEEVREQAALLDVANDAIMVRDSADRIVFWSRGAERAYGWSAAEARGQRVAELLGVDPARYAMAREELLASGSWEGELRKRTKDGRDILVLARWSLVRDAEGRPKSSLAINTDVTETRKLEAQFLRAQRTESIGTLASGIAHDLNNVLTPILFAVETLKGLATEEEDVSLLQMLEVSAQRGAALVRQVLTFARGVEGRRLAVQLPSLLADLVAMARDIFPKSVKLNFEPSAGLWTVSGDPTQMHQVFLNLLVNARDAMPRGGTLTIRADNIALDDTYAPMNPGSQPGNYVVVEIEDTGTGIPLEIQDRIFEPFFTTKGIGDGTGLGLSTTSAIMKSHSGFINVYSEMGKGTNFRVYFPALLEDGVSEEVAVQYEALPRGNGELILVADDEEGIRRVAARTLERFGYRVVLASNGAEAVALYAQRQFEIAAVLTDMAMPVMDGVATMLALRAINPDVTLIGSSGLTSEGSVARAFGAEVRYFVPKPYTAETMLRVLRAACAGREPGGAGSGRHAN